MQLLLAAMVGVGVWWRLAGSVDWARAVAYCGGVGLMFFAALTIVMLSHLPQAVATYHGAAFAMFALALQDRDLPKLLLR